MSLSRRASESHDAEVLPAPLEPVLAQSGGGGALDQGNAARLEDLGLGGGPVHAEAAAPAPTGPEFLSGALGTPIGQDTTHAIPTQIHRFWSGGAMSQAAMETLAETAEKTQGTPFVNNLWYSSHLEAAMDGAGQTSEVTRERRGLQRDVLRGLGYNVRDIAELAEDDPEPQGMFDRLRGRPAQQRTPGRLLKSDLGTMAGKASAKLADGGQDRWDGVKHISDIARLMYLNEVGGHHFDVDMGLGDMDLSHGYHHNDPNGLVPLLGAVTATSEDPIAADLARVGPGQDHDLRDPATAEAATRVATQARDMTGMLNGMMASRPGNPRLGAAIEQLRPDALHPASEIPSGMTVNPTLLFGSGPRPVDLQTPRAQAVPPYLLDLQHLTADSDNR